MVERGAGKDRDVERRSAPGAGGRDLRRDTLVLVTLAGVVRLLAHLAHRGSPFAAVPILDAELYDSWAREIAAGDWLGKEVFYANPLYPYFLAIIYKLTGGSAEAARIVQHVMGVVTVVLVHRLALAAAGRTAALAAGALAALYLPFFAFEDTLLIATLGVLLAATSLLAAIRADRRQTRTAWLLAGGVAGLALLARPTLMPLAVLVWASMDGGRPGTRAAPDLLTRGRLRLLPYLVGIILVILPVTIRNAAVSGRFVPITAHGGETFYVGNRPGSDGSNLQPDFVRSGPRYEHEDFRHEASRRLGREVDLDTSSRYWLRQGLDFILGEPAAYARLELRKVGLLLHAYEKGDNLDLDARRRVILLYRLPWPAYGLVAALGLLGGGWWLLARRRGASSSRVMALLVLVAAAQILSLLLYFVTARYRLPLLVPLLPLAGYAIAALVQVAATYRRRLIAPLVVLAVLLVVFHRPLPAGVRNDPALSAINLGFMYETAGDRARAAESYRRAIEHDPDLALAHFNLGMVERLQKNLPAANSAFRQALRIDPEYADAWEQLGMTLEQGGDLDGALAAYTRALRIEPGRALFYRDIGRLFVLRREPEKAIAAWERAIALEPEDTRTRQRLEALRAATDRAP